MGGISSAMMSGTAAYTPNHSPIAQPHKWDVAAGITSASQISSRISFSQGDALFLHV